MAAEGLFQGVFVPQVMPDDAVRTVPPDELPGLLSSSATLV